MKYMPLLIPIPHYRLQVFFLDISKAFDRVWHEGLIYKRKCMCVKSDLLTLIKSFFFERHERVVLNRQESEWLTVKAGMPQGSILGPLSFLIYINDYQIF